MPQPTSEMLSRQALLAVAIAFAFACVGAQPQIAQHTQPASKLATVTLLISGMT
jgi:hypothetical protein